MAINFLVQAAAGSANTTSAATSAIDTTGATLLIAAVTNFEAETASTLTDSQSNSWTALTLQSRPSWMRLRFFYVLNPTTNASHTFTVSSGVATYPSVAVMAFSGTLTASAFDQQNGVNEGAYVAPVSTGNVTPTEDNELVVTAASTEGSTPSVDSYYTQGTGVAFSSGNHWSLRMGYAIQTTATTKDATWTDASATRLCAVIATFKASSGGGGSVGMVGFRARRQVRNRALTRM